MKGRIINMSVVKSKRSESSVEFLDNARKLVIFTIQKCARFPKRFRFSLAAKIENLAGDIYQNASRANDINVLDIRGYDERKKAIEQACLDLKAIVGTIEIADEVFGIKAKVIEEWMRMVDYELRLLNGILKSDKKRFEKAQQK